MVRNFRQLLMTLILTSGLVAQGVLQITLPETGEAIEGDLVTVSFTLASYFSIGEPECVDCDGYITVFVNENFIQNVTSSNDFNINELYDGNYLLRLEAVNPSGYNFDPAIQDTVSFSIVGNPPLCAPYDLMVYPGDGRNTLEWHEPTLGPSGGADCGDYLINGLPYNDINTNLGMADDWDVTFSDGEDVAYTLNLTSETTIDVTLCNAGTGYDTKLEIFTFDGDCDSTYTGAISTGDYNDDFTCTFNGLYSTLDNVTLAEGQYYIVVDGFAGQTGNYELSITESTGRTFTQDSQTDFNLELLKSGLNPNDLFADFQNLQNARNSSSREVDILCGTFVQYNIYNQIDSSFVGSSDTTLYIHENLTNDLEYCYYVTAEYSEGESTNSDTACATPETFTPLPVTNLTAAGLDEEVALSWTEPSTPIFIFYEDFTNGIPATWDVIDGGTSNDTWTSPDLNHAFWTSFGDNLYAICDAAAAGTDSELDEELITPSLNFTNQSTPYLQFETYYNDGTLGSEYAEVDVSSDGGNTWTNVIQWDIDQGSSTQPFTVGVDLSAVAGDSSDVKIRFHYIDGGVWSWYWALDNVRILDSNPGTSRWHDGDLTHYNVYQDGLLIADSIEATSYLALDLTNTQSYTFGVTASYYPNYESDTVSVSASPTWLFGDITGTVTDPNGNPLDSAVVTTGTYRDTTGTDGVYTLSNLNPGLHNVVVKHPTFDNNNADVTVNAQEAAIVQDFTLIPKLDRPGSLELESVGQNVYLTWLSAGSMEVGCGDKLIPSLPYSDHGTNVGTGDEWDVAGGDGEDYTYTFYVFEDITITVDLCSPITDYDAKLEIFTADEFCVSTSTGYYNDDGPFGTCPDSPAPFTPSLLENVMLTEGVYYIVVDGFGGDTGNYEIFVTESEGGRGEVATAHMFDVSLEEEKLVDSGMTLSDVRTYVADFKEINFSDYLPLSVENSHEQNMPLVLTRTTTEDSLTGYNIYQTVDTGDSLILATYDEDTTAVIYVPENYVEYCFFVKARWYTSYGELESKPTPTVCIIPYLAGDVNSDDLVDINDLLSVVDFILEVAMPTEIQFRNSDLNRDDVLNVADVIMMIDIIIPGGNARRIATDVASIAELSLRNGGGTSLLLDLAYDGFVRGIQFDLSTDMSRLSFGSPLLNDLQEGVMINSHTLEDGSTRVLAVNMNGGLLSFSTDGFITVPVMINTDRGERVKVDLSGVQLIGQDGQNIPVVAKGDGSVALELIPMQYALYQNFPNPFNPVTEIQFDVPDVGVLDLVVYNLMGQQVRRLVNGEIQAGYHRVVWDGLNDRGEPVSTGVYIYSLTSPSFHNTKKMVLLK